LYNHASEDYICPFCRIACDGENKEIVYRDDTVTAFMSMHDAPNNLGHVVVIPNDHYENIYDLPVPVAAKIHECARIVALAMKSAYHCDGITLRQNNEPHGGQDVWHYHMHIYPRYEGDDFPRVNKAVTPEEKRVEYAGKLRKQLVNHA
jgi:histidine triad (HIT) family protein